MIAEAVLSAASVLVRWIPIRFQTVHEYEQGVRFWMGRATKLLDQPGVYVYIPWLGDIETETVVPQEVETSTQCVMADGQARTFSIGLQYEVADLRKKLIAVEDFDNSLLNLVERVAAKVMRDPDMQDLDKAILQRVRTQAEKWGVKINYLGVLNDVRSRPMHHFIRREE